MGLRKPNGFRRRRHRSSFKLCQADGRSPPHICALESSISCSDTIIFCSCWPWLILVRTWRRVVLTVTAFTVAHSITLAAATLGIVNVPGPPVEAAIALSIVLVAVEIVNARRGIPSLTARWPWLVAFCFGLLHGFGFAGALAEVGLPHHAIPVALLFFNLGVETGQLSFVAAVLTLAWMLKAAASLRFKPDVVQRSINRFDVTAGYAIGAVAAYWVIGRAATLFA